MKIYMISPNLVWGGAATANISIARMLSKEHTVYYNDEYNNVNIEGVTYDSYPTHQSKNSKQLVEYLISKGIDVVIWGVVMNIPYYRKATKLLHKNSIMQCAIFHSLSITKDIKGLVMEWMITRSLKYVNHLVFVSEYTDISWSKYRTVRSHPNHHVIYNPIPLEEHNVRNDLSRIGFVGRFSKEKQPELFAKLSEKENSNSYIAWGDGELLENLKSKYPAVVFKGQSSSEKEIYESFDILVMTSEFENCPMVILEAWKYGIPCVVPAVGGIPEIVNDKNTGRLYSNYSVETISSCISDIQSDYRRYSSNCIAAIERFSFDTLYKVWSVLLDNKKQI